MSLKFNDCSWFHQCEPRRLQPSQHHRTYRVEREQAPATARVDATAGNGLLPSFRNRLHLAAHLKSLGLRDGVELGVRGGMHTEQLLDIWHARRFVLVDAWTSLRQLPRSHGYDAQYAGATHDRFFDLTMQRRLQRPSCSETIGEAVRSGGRCGTSIEVCRNWTHVCAERFADASFDYIYVDALHDYKGVLRDLTQWWPKLRRGGIMAGHDYHDANSSFLSSRDRQKVRSWRQNYDGTREESGKLVKGAVDDFFGCVANLQDEHEVAPPWPCDHRRRVEVALSLSSSLQSLTNSQDYYPPSWAVQK